MLSEKKELFNVVKDVPNFSSELTGLLLVAKEKGFVESVGTYIKELRNNGYWLSDNIMKTAIKLAGE